MQIKINGKQIDLGDALRTHVESTLTDTVGRYFQNPIDGTVTISREGTGFKVDILVHPVRGITLKGEANGHDPHATFDAAVARMDKRLRRYKRQLKDHHGKSGGEVREVSQYVLRSTDDGAGDAEGDGDGSPVVVAEMVTHIERLTVSEAVMRLELGDLPALMFRSRRDDEVNMIYRRPDGNIGWVDPSGALPAQTKEG